jgi:hypothetical protein
MAWFNGEECAQDSGVHHLAHAMACLAILLDAKTCGKLNDDRPPPVDMQALYDTLKLDLTEGGSDGQAVEKVR